MRRNVRLSLCKRYVWVKIRSLSGNRDKKKKEVFTTLKDLGLTVCEVSSCEFPAKERTRAGEFLPVRYALHKQAFLAKILNTSYSSDLQRSRISGQVKAQLHDHFFSYFLSFFSVLALLRRTTIVLTYQHTALTDSNKS